jgi:hypothetical protein
MQNELHDRLKLPLGDESVEEGTKGRLYFLPPHRRPRAVDAIVERIDRDGVVFRFVGPTVAPPPVDPRGRHVRLSASWLWVCHVRRSTSP